MYLLRYMAEADLYTPLCHGFQATPPSYISVSGSLMCYIKIIAGNMWK